MRLATLLTVLALGIGGRNAAAETLPRIVSPPQALGGCLAPSAKARIIALGAYEANGAVPFYAPSSAHDAGVITVAGDKKGPPVVLILSAYDPVIWDLRQVPRGRIEGVVVFGYSSQAVVGLPRDVPLRFSAGRKADPQCGAPTYAYKGGPALERLAATVEKAVARRIDAFYGDYAPNGFNIDGGGVPQPDVASISLNMLRGSERFDVSAVPPREAGVAMLLKQGAIRRPLPQDQIDLDAALTKASSTGYLAPVHMPLDRRAYVILKPITVPRGMYGGHSATFLIAKGVPNPIDPGSHNQYTRLDDGTCVRGTRCRLGNE